MSGQISLFSIDLDTPVANEPAPEVVIALEETEQPTGIADVISPESGNDEKALSQVIALEGVKEVVLSLAEEAGMPRDQANERIVVARILPPQEEQLSVSVDTLPEESEGVKELETTIAEISQELGVPESDVAAFVGFEEQPAVSADTLLADPEVIAPEPAITPEKQFDLILKEHWANSQDLAYCMINIALPQDDDYLFDDFTDHIQACRLATDGQRSQPPKNERFERLAWCLGQMAFSKISHGGKGKVNRVETTVLDLAIALSNDLDELGELREFGVRGASGERITKLAWAIKTYVEQKIDEVIIPAGAPEAEQIIQNVQHLLDEMKQSTYAILFDRLGVPKEKIPDFSTMDSILSALLDAIGADERKLDLVLTYSDITEKQLFKAAERDIETQQRLLEIERRRLKHDLNGFYATSEWHQHRCFARYPVALTDGALYLAQHGGAKGATAFWLMDVIASYQGEKQMRRIENPQLWKIKCTGEGSKRSCVVSCGNNPEKPIIKQEIEYTNFLLDEYELYASLEPYDESGKLALIISLIAER
jgi:hypothetical protein